MLGVLPRQIVVLSVPDVDVPPSGCLCWAPTLAGGLGDDLGEYWSILFLPTRGYTLLHRSFLRHLHDENAREEAFTSPAM
jgi:hypothetical protein